MEQKKTIIIVIVVFALLMAVAVPLYNRLSRDAQPDQLITLPQQENPTETPTTQPAATKPEETQPTNPPETPTTQPTNPSENPTTQPTDPTVTLEYDFTVVDGNGKSVKLSDYVGKPIVLNFWASWCGPCKSEMPEFQQVFAEMGEQVQFLMVNATASDTMADAKSFINQYGYTFPVVFDTRGEALYTYGVDAFPTTFFLDKTGTVAGYAVGAISKDTLLKGIDMITK